MKPGNRILGHGANSSWGLLREIREVTPKKNLLKSKRGFFILCTACDFAAN
jgi:hypothetical protein